MHTYDDYAGLRGIWAVEVYNNETAKLCGQQDTDRPFVEMLRAGASVFPICTDDSHHPGTRFGGFTMIKTPDFSYGGIINALEKGDFYSSMGPLIKELVYEDGKVTVRTSGVKEILLATERRYNRVKTAESGEMDEAVLDISDYLEQNETVQGKRWPSYFRIRIKDSQGRYAYSRAYWIGKDI